MYYGWWIVAATTTVFTLVMGITYSAYGLYVIPISEEFGLSRADANSGLIILNVGVAVLSPFLGRALDRIPARRIMIASSLVFMIAYALLASTRAIWMGVAVFALVLPFAVKGAGTLTAPLLIVRWFTVRRGRAMTLSQLGLSLGGLVVPPLAGLLIADYGWRTALLVTGVGGGLILLGISLAIRESPRPGELEAPPPGLAGEGLPAPGAGEVLSATTILASPVFWLINLSCGAVAAISTALLVSLVPFGRERGLSVIEAASLISVMSASGIGAKMAIAFVADRIDRILLLAGLFLVGALLNGALMIAGGFAWLVCVAVCLGLVNSGVTPLQFALVADRFGARSFGVATGLTIPLTAVLGIVSVRFSGEVFDRTGGYDLMFATFLIVQALAAAMILGARFTQDRAALPAVQH